MGDPFLDLMVEALDIPGTREKCHNAYKKHLAYIEGQLQGFVPNWQRVKLYQKKDELLKLISKTADIPDFDHESYSVEPPPNSRLGTSGSRRL